VQFSNRSVGVSPHLSAWTSLDERLFRALPVDARKGQAPWATKPKPFISILKFLQPVVPCCHQGPRPTRCRLRVLWSRVPQKAIEITIENAGWRCKSIFALWLMSRGAVPGAGTVASMRASITRPSKAGPVYRVARYGTLELL